MGGRKRAVSHLTPEETEKLTSDGELSILLSGPSSGALFSCPHCFLCHLYFSVGDTVKWEFLGEPCCSWSEPGWEGGRGEDGGGYDPLHLSRGEGWPPRDTLSGYW